MDCLTLPPWQNPEEPGRQDSWEARKLAFKGKKQQQQRAGEQGSSISEHAHHVVVADDLIMPSKISHRSRMLRSRKFCSSDAFFQFNLCPKSTWVEQVIQIIFLWRLCILQVNYVLCRLWSSLNSLYTYVLIQLLQRRDSSQQKHRVTLLASLLFLLLFFSLRITH